MNTEDKPSCPENLHSAQFSIYNPNEQQAKKKIIENQDPNTNKTTQTTEMEVLNETRNSDGFQEDSYEIITLEGTRFRPYDTTQSDDELPARNGAGMSPIAINKSCKTCSGTNAVNSKKIKRLISAIKSMEKENYEEKELMGFPLDKQEWIANQQANKNLREHWRELYNNKKREHALFKSKYDKLVKQMKALEEDIAEWKDLYNLQCEGAKLIASTKVIEIRRKRKAT